MTVIKNQPIPLNNVYNIMLRKDIARIRNPELSIILAPLILQLDYILENFWFGMIRHWCGFDELQEVPLCWLLREERANALMQLDSQRSSVNGDIQGSLPYTSYWLPFPWKIPFFGMQSLWKIRHFLTEETLYPLLPFTLF